MSTGNKVISIALLFFVALTVSAKYYKYSVAEDFYISSELSCDPSSESCFVWDCDVTDEECDQTPYKYIWKYAANVPTCDPRVTDECEELTCSPTEDDCEIILCSEDTVGEEEFCTAEALE